MTTRWRRVSLSAVCRAVIHHRWVATYSQRRIVLSSPKGTRFEMRLHPVAEVRPLCGLWEDTK